MITLQVTSENIISCSHTLLLSPASPGIDPVCVDDNVQPEGGCALEKQAFVTDTGNPLCRVWAT